MSTHADASWVPEEIHTKPEFWAHVYDQLTHLLEGQHDWVSNLANTSALIYHALHTFHAHFGQGAKEVNWCGFYIHSRLYPPPLYSSSESDTAQEGKIYERLLLGPFCGKPACQYITIAPPKSAKGVCSAAFNQQKTILIDNVDEYPGHIPCDATTKSEIVCPLLLRRQGEEPVVLGVLDLDCVAVSGFDQHDQEALEKIATLVVSSCAW